MPDATASPNHADAVAIRNAGVAMLAVAAGALLLAFGTHRAPAGAAAEPAPVDTSALDASSAPTPVIGLATFYADAFQGQLMADGTPFDMNDPGITASNSWPLGTRLLVRRVSGGPWDGVLSPDERNRFFGRTIVVTVRDHGSFSHELDLSLAAFSRLGRPEEGVIRVEIVPLTAAAAAP
jgi:rare lipoprotein A (peptidoglycan hydrolase)